MRDTQESNSGINLRLWSLATAVVLLSVFVLFVVIYERQARRRATSGLEQHSKVIAAKLWNFNHTETSMYLKLISRKENYSRAVVKTADGEVFERVKGICPNLGCRILEQFGFKRSYRLRSPVIFRDRNIGSLEVSWYPGTEQIYAYVFLVLALLGGTLHLVYRLYNSKVLLSHRVQERVSELQKSNRALVKEVKQREQAEQKLQQSEKKFRSYVECSPHGIFVLDDSGVLSEVNPALCRMSGYTEEKLVGKGLADLVRPERVDEIEAQFAQLGTNNEVQFTTPIENAAGERRHWEVSAVQLSGGNVLGMVTDITQRRQTREKLEQSVREKEVLLQEVHHRVKNNLFTIISLLELQKVKYDDEKLVGILRRSINRIHSMALIHKELYSSDENVELEFGKYLKQIVAEIEGSVTPPDKQAEVEFDLEPVRFDLDRAIPCALAINELVDNALTHGFEGREKLRLKIESEVGPGSLVLRVADNGRGLPEDFSLSDSVSMGLNLVVKLVENQLGGSVDYSSNAWTTFELQFDREGREPEARDRDSTSPV